MPARNYTNTHVATTLSAGISSGATSITPLTLTGLPVSYPYTLVIGAGTSKVEVVTVTASAGANLTVTRGEDGTLAQAHDPGETLTHALTARDAYEPQTHINATGNVHGIGAPSSVVGTATAQTLTNKTISGAANTFTNIPNSALDAIAAAKVTQPFASLAATGAGAFGSLSVSGTSTLGTTNAGAISGSSMSLSGAETVGGNQTVNGTSSLKATTVTTLTATGNASVGGTLGVTGASTVAALAADSVTVGTTLGVTGTTTAAVVNATVVNGSTDVRFNGTSLPRGYVGKATATANAVSDSGSGQVAFVPVTFTAVAGRRYRFTLNATYSSSGADPVGLYIRWNTGASPNTGANTLVARRTVASLPGTALPVSITDEATGLTPGQVTAWAGILYTAPSTATMYANANCPALLLVEDIGV